MLHRGQTFQEPGVLLTLLHSPTQVVVLPHQGAELPETGGHEIEHPSPCSIRNFLGETGDIHALRHPAFAVVWLQLACDDPEQSGLTGTVSTDKADAFTLFDVEADYRTGSVVDKRSAQRTHPTLTD
jgi:hypothetical protein